MHAWPLGWQEGSVDCTVWPIFNEHVTSPGGATAHYLLLQYCRVSACWSVRPLAAAAIQLLIYLLLQLIGIY